VLEAVGDAVILACPAVLVAVAVGVGARSGELQPAINAAAIAMATHRSARGVSVVSSIDKCDLTLATGRRLVQRGAYRSNQAWLATVPSGAAERKASDILSQSVTQRQSARLSAFSWLRHTGALRRLVHSYTTIAPWVELARKAGA
jgi:hypothetical protein